MRIARTFLNCMSFGAASVVVIVGVVVWRLQQWLRGGSCASSGAGK